MSNGLFLHIMHFVEVHDDYCRMFFHPASRSVFCTKESLLEAKLGDYIPPTLNKFLKLAIINLFTTRPQASSHP